MGSPLRWVHFARRFIFGGGSRLRADYQLLEDAPRSNSKIRVKEPHFKVFPEFKDVSYAKRYEILMLKLLRSRLYDSACLLLSSKKGGVQGEYREPHEELSFSKFVVSLTARAFAAAQVQPPKPEARPKLEPDNGEK